MSGLEQHKQIDIRILHKNKPLEPGVSYLISWNSGGDNPESMEVTVKENSLLLIYRNTSGGESDDVNQRIQLDWTPCNYGGKRPWFICPGCGRRVGILALGGKLFLCRHCYRLKYSSQLETELDRAHRRVRKIAKRLDENEQRPKGMHKKSYDRLRRRLIDAESQVEGILQERIGRIVAQTFLSRKRR